MRGCAAHRGRPDAGHADPAGGSEKKNSEGCQAARAGSLDAGAFQDQRAEIMPPGATATLGVVCREQGTFLPALENLDIWQSRRKPRSVS